MTEPIVEKSTSQRLTPNAILVIQLRRIGDVILITPALAALKRRYPEARLDILVEAPGAQALEGNPHAGVWIYDGRGLLSSLRWAAKVRARRYDWVIDLLGNPRSALLTGASGAAVRAGPQRVSHRWAYNRLLPQPEKPVYNALEKILMLAPLGVPSDGADFLPKLYLTGPAARDNVIGLVPASRKPTRRWPAASYAELGRMLRKRYGCRLLVFWGPGERPLAEEVASAIGEGASATPPTRTLKEAAQLLSGCRLVVTNCNGPKHMAVALGVPTVTVHGSSDPTSWNPPCARHVVVRREELPCIGCRLNRCPYRLECLDGLPAGRVFEAASRLMESQ